MIYTPTTQKRRHPVYRHMIYWATVQDSNGRPLEQCGPYRTRIEAMAKAYAMAYARKLKGESNNAL